jgi:hypothetical protein
VRRKGRVDVTQGSIVIALRAIGASVQPLSAVGRGCPDLLCGWDGKNVLMEIKQPYGPRGGTSEDGQLLNTEQLKWHRAWKGQVAVVRSIDQAMDALGIDKPEVPR